MSAKTFARKSLTRWMFGAALFLTAVAGAKPASAQALRGDLGLDMVQGKAVVGVMVVDHVEPPSGN